MQTQPWYLGAATDYREVVARRARHMPLTPQGVVALLEAEREAQVMNWIMEGRLRRAMRVTRAMFLVKPDGTLTEMYAV